MKTDRLQIIGGGLAGCEAARRISRAGLEVDLYEMKPARFSPAHSSPDLAELVCSNSFRSADPNSAVGLLKEEMRRLGSVIMEAADSCSVPAGKALAVDRSLFSAKVTEIVKSMSGVRIIRSEKSDLDEEVITVLSTGPLTSDAMSDCLSDLIGAEHLYFYDAIAPIVLAESVDMDIAFVQSRYEEPGIGDYINCPMSETEYERFYAALMEAERAPLRDFEKPRFFEGCLPIEVMAERGAKTLTFGPMKPVGLVDPRTGQRPYAVVQLRKENTQGTLFNLVGFQTRLKWSEQARVLRLIPGLENAEFTRWGSVHRNTFIQGPEHLTRFLDLQKAPNIFMAGQITGVEGYVESAAAGIIAGENAARKAMGRPLITPPSVTALGCLLNHLTDKTVRNFQPSNVNFGLMPPIPGKVRKKERPALYVQRAREEFDKWIEETAYEV